VGVRDLSLVLMTREDGDIMGLSEKAADVW